ncbi:MAG: hypothetical protein ACFFFB_24205, partial [Candidatus Heimdallarchaeota archaeon]
AMHLAGQMYNYLVTNSTEPTAKYTKAQDFGIKVITENELKAMVERGEHNNNNLYTNYSY